MTVTLQKCEKSLLMQCMLGSDDCYAVDNSFLKEEESIGWEKDRTAQNMKRKWLQQRDVTGCVYNDDTLAESERGKSCSPRCVVWWAGKITLKHQRVKEKLQILCKSDQAVRESASSRNQPCKWLILMSHPPPTLSPTPPENLQGLPATAAPSTYGKHCHITRPRTLCEHRRPRKNHEQWQNAKAQVSSSLNRGCCCTTYALWQVFLTLDNTIAGARECVCEFHNIWWCWCDRKLNGLVNRKKAVTGGHWMEWERVSYIPGTCRLWYSTANTYKLIL